MSQAADALHAANALETIRTLGRLLDDLERVRIMNSNRIGALERAYGSTLPHLAEIAEPMNAAEHLAELELVRAWRKHELAPWAKAVRGLGEKSIARLIAEIGDPAIGSTGHWETSTNGARASADTQAAIAPDDDGAIVQTDDQRSDAPKNRTWIIDEHFERSVSQLWQYCIPEGEMVATPTGHRPIETLSEEGSIFGADGEAHEINAVLSRHYSGEVLNVKARKMLPFRCTPEHPVLVAKFSQRWDRATPDAWTRESLEWQRADAIQVGDYLVIPKLSAQESNVDLSLARFWGRFVGDGSTMMGREGKYERGRCALSFGKHEAVDEWKETAQTQGAVALVELPTSNRLDFGRTRLARKYRERFGTHANNKRACSDVLLGDRDTTLAFLDGYLSADGHRLPTSVRQRAAITANTVSCGLALDLQLLSTRLGALPRIGITKKGPLGEIGGRIVNLQDRYELGWNGTDAERITGIESASWKTRHREDDDYFYVEVVSVNKEPYEGRVYDLECGGSFLVNNMIVHNCGVGDPARSKIPQGATQAELMARGKPRAKKQLFLIATSMLKTGNRDVYDAARAHYAERIHDAACPPCHAKPGDPWKPGHQHMAALRKVEKEFLKDLWREARRLKGLEYE